MSRRILIEHVTVGDIEIDSRQAHHLRNVLRIATGTTVEVFDKAGNVGEGIIKEASESRVIIRVNSIQPKSLQKQIYLTIASAIPKAARADWLIEKCGELDVDIFIPLQTHRSVTAPEGKNKFERWERIAVEASKQSHRTGVLQIKPMLTLQKAIENAREIAENHFGGIYLSTQPGSKPLRLFCDEMKYQQITHVTAFIGPEGGWTDDEMKLMDSAGFTAVGLTSTILRIETAALAAAAIIKSC